MDETSLPGNTSDACFEYPWDEENISSDVKLETRTCQSFLSLHEQNSLDEHCMCCARTRTKLFDDIRIRKTFQQISEESSIQHSNTYQPTLGYNYWYSCNHQSCTVDKNTHKRTPRAVHLRLYNKGRCQRGFKFNHHPDSTSDYIDQYRRSHTVCQAGQTYTRETTELGSAPWHLSHR